MESYKVTPQESVAALAGHRRLFTIIAYHTAAGLCASMLLLILNW
jgi:hypothetical protein